MCLNIDRNHSSTICKSALVLFFFFLCCSTKAQSVNAQDVRYVFKNTSNLNQLQYTDQEIYIAAIGRSNTVGGGASVFLDNLQTTTPNLVLMSPAYNTLPGPNGALFGDIFTRLSDLPADANGDYYIDIPPMFGAQIWIGLGSPMYIPLQNGAYAGADIHNPASPNFNVKFEVIEFTQTQADRVISNTTRVDVYQYPMGQEVFGPNDEYIKVGETATHEQVLAKYKLFVDEPFLATIDEEKGVIHQPTTVPEFQTGGAQANYFEDFVDQMWATYSTRTLQAQWRGAVHTATVQGNQLVWDNGERIDKPTTAQIVGGTGQLNNGFGQILGVALNRGVIDLNNTGIQVWDDEASYYKTTPKNDYTHFFHSDLVSFESQTYAFAYDDVFDHSSTSTMDHAEKVVISIGGFGIEHAQTLTNIYIDPQNTSIDEFQTFPFTVKGLDQGMLDMALPSDAVITWSVVGNASLIDQNGNFGPAAVGAYTVNVQVVTNGITYQASATITVNPEGTSGQVCVGEINQYADYRIESEANKVFITFVPRPNFNGNGWIRLFFARPNGTGNQAYDVQANQAFELYGVFKGSTLDFNYLYQAAAPPQIQSPLFNIPNVGTCDGLTIEEYLTRIEIVEQNITLAEGEEITLSVIGKSNQGNDFPISDPIVWTGQGVDANGKFTAKSAGTYTIRAIVNGIVHETTITVTSTTCKAVVVIEGNNELCNEASTTYNLSGGTFVSQVWSGTGSDFIGPEKTLATPIFTANGTGNFELIVNVEDINGCVGDTSVTITVNPIPVADISNNPTQFCNYSEAITLTSNLTGGIFTGNGVVNNTFIPNSISTYGTPFAITYNYTDPITTCVAEEVEINFIVTKTTAPTGADVSVFNQEISSQNDVPTICAEGNNISWYNTIDAISPISTATNCFATPFIDQSQADGVMDEGIYSMFITQTENNCESERIEIRLVVQPCTLTASIDYEVSPNLHFENDTLKLCNNGEVVVLKAETNDASSVKSWLQLPSAAPLSESTIDNNFTTNTQGSYYVIVKDKDAPNQCFTSSDTIHLATINPVTPSITLVLDTNEVCAHDLQTISSTSINEGFSPVYKWLINEVEQPESSATLQTNRLNDGDVVQVFVTSSLGCVAVSEVASKSIQILKNPTLSPAAKIGGTLQICENTPLSLQLIDTINFGNHFKINWTKNNAPVATTIHSGDIDVTTSDLLSVHITDLPSCSDKATLTIPVDFTLTTPLKPVLNQYFVELCTGETTELFTNTATETLTWYKNGIPLKNGNTITVEEEGLYQVKIEGGICAIQASEMAEVVVYQKPVVDAGEDARVFSGSNYSFDASATLSSKIEWQTTAQMDNPLSLQATITPTESDFHILTATNGTCTSTDSVYIRVELPLKIPNTFSPNGDQINDTWELIGMEEYPKAHLAVFNRWGLVIYEAFNGVTEFWTGEEYPVGTYYYVLELGNSNATLSNQTLTGAITITR